MHTILPGAEVSNKMAGEDSHVSYIALSCSVGIDLSCDTRICSRRLSCEHAGSRGASRVFLVFEIQALGPKLLGKPTITLLIRFCSFTASNDSNESSHKTRVFSRTTEQMDRKTIID